METELKVLGGAAGGAQGVMSLWQPVKLLGNCGVVCAALKVSVRFSEEGGGVAKDAARRVQCRCAFAFHPPEECLRLHPNSLLSEFCLCD